MDESKLISKKPEDVYEERANMESNISEMAKLTLKMAKMVQPKDKEIGELETKIRDIQTNAEKKAAELKSKVEQSNSVRMSKLDILKIPDNVSLDWKDTTVDLKELKSAVGPLNSQTAPHIKFWFEKLFTYAPKYDHEQYKAALGSLAQDEILDQFMSIRHEPFAYIAKWLYDVHHQPNTVSDIEAKIKNFHRKKNEKIKATMKRYEVLAKTADSYYPKEQQIFDKDNNKIKILLDYMAEPAKSDLEDWRNSRLDSGFYSPYSLVIDIASDLELKHKCIPQEDVELSTIDINAIDINALDPRDFRSTKEIREARKNRRGNYKQSVKDKREKQMQERRLLDHVDPKRATAAKPSYYGDRNADSNMVPEPTTDQHMAEPNQPYPQQQQPEKPKYQKSFKKNGYQGKNNKKKYDGKKGSGGKSSPPTGQLIPYRGKENYPRQQKPPIWKKGSGQNRQVLKHLYCSRCGIPKDPAQLEGFAGSDHQTSYCKVYSQYNPFGCSHCLSRNIDARHYPDECRQKDSA